MAPGAPPRAAIIRTAAVLVLSAVVLFGSAGTIRILAFWAYLAVLAVACGAGLFVIDPVLAEERMRPGGRRLGVAYLLIALLPFIYWALAGVDRGRVHWSDRVPPALQVVALMLFALALALLLWAMHVNRFFSSVVRIQSERGHRVVDTGPYRWVRHPGYVAAILLALTTGVALGSWLATAFGACCLPLVAWRILAEDRVLRAELPGYADYARRVRVAAPARPLVTGQTRTPVRVHRHPGDVGRTPTMGRNARSRCSAARGAVGAAGRARGRADGRGTATPMRPSACELPSSAAGA